MLGLGPCRGGFPIGRARYKYQSSHEELQTPLISCCVEIMYGWDKGTFSPQRHWAWLVAELGIKSDPKAADHSAFAPSAALKL